MSVDVIVQQADPDPGRAQPGAGDLKHWARTTLARAGKLTAEITVRIVSEAEITTLNRRYRNQEKSTNVLAFTYPAQDAGGVTGDIVMCAAVIEREQTAAQHAHPAHWAHICIHGVLHLCGYDHQQPEQAEAMEALEKEIMHKLGYPDPYA